MAGFYGKISNTNKSSFSFDITYPNRDTMDQQCATDQVFLGRYVLVEYDEPPITGYKIDNAFYVDSQGSKQIQPVRGRTYQDLFAVNTQNSFWFYDGTTYESTYGSTPFAINYNVDVGHYGRGYDSTAWVKTVDAETGEYRYVLIAELNTIVPNFHLVADPPSNTPIAPYFDGQTTNLDYYIHVPAQYGHRIAENINGKSDENIFSRYALWDNATQTYLVGEDLEPVPGDIFYNRAGFNKMQRTVVTSGTVHMGNNSQYAAGDIDSINFTMGTSGRKYYGTNGTGVVRDDTVLWHIYLPSIGNTIAEVWDYMFTASRKTQFLYETGENEASTTIDTGSILGVSNTMRNYIGKIYELSANVNNGYTAAEIVTNKPMVIKYKDFSDKRHYYYPVYANVWTQDANGAYWYDSTDHTYKVANKSALPAGTTYYRRDYESNNKPYMRYKEAYSRTLAGIIAGGEAARYQDEDSDTVMPNTVFGTIAYINRLLGTGLAEDDSRDDRTVIGLMNRMRDTIANVDTQLTPGRICYSDVNGVLTTSNILYPYAGTGDHQELLDSSGTWRLPVTYKLETLNLKNTTNNTKYFDAGYYGNSCLHAVLASDTLGQAIRKMQNEMADLQYIQQTVDSFTVSLSNGETILLENGSSMTAATLTYELNKGPRQSITITRTAPSTATIYSQTNIDPECYVTNAASYAASQSGVVVDNNTMLSQTNATMTWKISVKDERDYIAEKTVSAFWTDRYYYGVGAAISDLSNIATRALLDAAITGGGNKLARSKPSTNFTVNASTDSLYIYYMQPASWNKPTFYIGTTLPGGMDELGTFTFENESGYSTSYRIWRSVNAGLGSRKVVIE